MHARFAGTAVLLLLCAACSGGDQGRIAFELSLQNLPPLGDEGGVYEGWAVIDGQPFSTGKFRIDPSTTPHRIIDPRGLRTYGTVDGAVFGPASTRLGDDFPFILDATDFFITVEPEGDLDFLPSGAVVLSGTFDGNVAPLGPALTGGDLQTAAGQALLITPTTTSGSPENGVWFVLDATGTPALTLPPLSGFWSYEARITDGTTTLSLGAFPFADQPDLDASTAPTRGADSIGFAAPGQDFVQPAVVGAAETLDLADGNWRFELTVEPIPDTSLEPFPLPLFAADIPMEAVDSEGRAAMNVELLPAAAVWPLYAVTITPTTFDLIAPAGNPGLPDLGPARNGHYELWTETGAVATSVVRFRVDGGQVLELTGGTVLGTPEAITLDTANVPGLPDLSGAERVFVTVEPQGDPVPEPSFSRILSGTLIGGGGLITTASADAIGALQLGVGTFTLRSPTNDVTTPVPDDQKGIWFVALSSTALRTLDLFLPVPGWIYEGWVVNDMTGARWSTGRFIDSRNADRDASLWPGRGDDGVGFSAPGQDFIKTVPGTTVPVIDLHGGWTLMVSIEPFPDSSPEPFLPLLQGPIPMTGTTVPPLENLLLPGASVPTVLPSGQVFYEDP